MLPVSKLQNLAISFLQCLSAIYIYNNNDLCIYVCFYFPSCYFQSDGTKQVQGQAETAEDHRRVREGVCVIHNLYHYSRDKVTSQKSGATNNFS